MADSERDVLAEALHGTLPNCIAPTDPYCYACHQVAYNVVVRGWRLVPSAQPSAEPGLDVERLAMAIPYPMMRRDEPWADFATRTAEYIAEKYAALIPDRPTPTDRLTEARDEAAYWRRQAIEAQRREGA